MVGGRLAALALVGALGPAILQLLLRLEPVVSVGTFWLTLERNRQSHSLPCSCQAAIPRSTDARARSGPPRPVGLKALPFSRLYCAKNASISSSSPGRRLSSACTCSCVRACVATATSRWFWVH